MSLRRKLFPRKKVPGVRWISPECVVIDRTKTTEFVRDTHWSRVESALESAGWDRRGRFIYRCGRQFFWIPLRKKECV